MATQTEILRIEVDNEQAQKNIEEQSKLIEGLRNQNQKLQKQNKELSKDRVANSKQIAENSEQIARNSAVITQATQKRKQNINVQKNEAGTLNNLRSQLALLTQERNRDLKVGSEAFDQANKNIKALNDQIKAAEEQGGDFRRSVGNYSKALEGAKGAFGGLVGSIDSATGSTGLLNAALLANPFGIIVTVLGALVAAFTQTEEGAVKFRIVLEVIKSVLNDFIGLLAVGGKEVVNFFENPLESLKSFGKAINDFVIRRVEAVLDSLGTLGEAFKLLFEGEFSEAADKAKEGFVDLAKSTNPLLIAYEELEEPIGNLIEGTKEYTDQIIENSTATANNVIAQRNLEKQRTSLEKQIVKLSKEEERLKQLSEDSTLSFQEQAQAQTQLEQVQEQRFNKQLELANKERDIAKTNLEIRKNQGLDTLELEKEFAEAEKNLFEIQGDQRLANTENLRITRQRDQDIWEQELDFIIDVGEREREVFKRQAEDQNLSIEERTEALARYQESLNTFQQAIRTQFDELGLSDEEINRLLGIKDPKELAEAITSLENLSEVEKNRLREGLIELKTTEFEREDTINSVNQSIADTEAKIEEERTKKIAEEEKKREALRKQRLQNGLNLTKAAVDLASEIIGKETKAGKALAIASAGINTAQAVTKTLATYGGTPFGIAQAALVGAAGLKQIQEIKNTDVSGGSTGATTGASVGSLSTSTSQTQVDTSNVDNEVNQQQALIDALESQRYQVSVTEINDVQNSVQVAEASSTI